MIHKDTIESLLLVREDDFDCFVRDIETFYPSTIHSQQHRHAWLVSKRTAAALHYSGPDDCKIVEVAA
jgi:hypothetical protein